ncbi:MAG: TlpA disulfide reductase family protein [Bacteroidia bacterium]|nr:TlpA family protein disulfide reductase [Bacteroidia bacterium]MDW8159326.1 TlpA disulfide reductase family protein [Bacteroidia bacterium]
MKNSNQEPIPFRLQGFFTQLSAIDSVILYEFFAGEYYKVISIPLQKQANYTGGFELSAAVPQKAPYWLSFSGISPKQNGLLIWLGDEPKVEFKANAQQVFETVVFNNSPINQKLTSMLRKGYEIQGEIQQVLQELNYYRNTDASLALAKQAQLDSLTAVQAAYFDKMSKEKGIVGKAAGLYLWKPFDKEAQAKYKDEQEYFKNEFLATIDFSDPSISYFPIFHDKITTYANSLVAQMNLTFLDAVPFFEKYHNQIPKGSRTEKAYLLALMEAIAQARYNSDFADIYLHFSEKFLQSFPNEPGAEERRRQLNEMGRLRIGQPAPEIALSSPDGKTIKLSQLRGKVVLLDFWASWCGPCRRENPHVVKTYKHYNPKGFEVFSVSLDNNAENWKRAIKEDNLMWPYHVSDLRGWQSSAAQLYGVTSIPFTILLDKEGRIIAKNLRGQQLEQRLRKIFGD